MKPRSSDTMARLRAADPARHTVADDTERDRLWQLIAATPSDSAPSDGTAAGARRRATPRRAARARLRQLRLAIPTVLVLTACALVATGVVRAGAPPEPAGGLSAPQREGGLVSRTVRLLPLTAPEPGGGPPWGAASITYKLDGQAHAHDDGP
jgi:hypothetical protein